MVAQQLPKLKVASSTLVSRFNQINSLRAAYGHLCYFIPTFTPTFSENTIILPIIKRPVGGIRRAALIGLISNLGLKKSFQLRQVGQGQMKRTARRFPVFPIKRIVGIDDACRLSDTTLRGCKGL